MYVDGVLDALLDAVEKFSGTKSYTENSSSFKSVEMCSKETCSEVVGHARLLKTDRESKHEESEAAFLAKRAEFLFIHNPYGIRKMNM